MTELIFFVLGIVFIELLFPIIEVLTAIVETKSEVIKYKDASVVAKYNKQIRDLAEDDEPLANPIGFCISNNEEIEDDDE